MPNKIPVTAAEFEGLRSDAYDAHRQNLANHRHEAVTRDVCPCGMHTGSGRTRLCNTLVNYEVIRSAK